MNIWESYYNELVKFKEDHGTLLIPHDLKEYAYLRKWTRNQRINFKENLSQEQISKLKDIGFDFQISNEERWDLWFKELENFKNENGHITISYKNKNHYKLSIWLNNQIRRYKAGKLKKERMIRLKELGANWIK